MTTKKRSKDRRFCQTTPIGVSIREAPVDGKGNYDERTCTVTINPDLPTVGKHIIVLHELLHAVDAQLVATGISKRRVTHQWIKDAAPNLFLLLTAAGFWNGPSLSECKKFYQDQGDL
jgi:hypothetical protein